MLHTHMQTLLSINIVHASFSHNHTHTQACSDKLLREMNDFGFPPKFPEEPANQPDLGDESPDPSDPTKRAKKVKSKVAAKGGGVTYQWEIMRGLGLGIEDEEIKR